MGKRLFIIIIFLMSQVLNFSVSAVSLHSKESFQFVVRSNNVTPGRFAHVNAPGFHEMCGMLESFLSLSGFPSATVVERNSNKLTGKSGSLFEKILRSQLCSREDIYARLMSSEPSVLFLEYRVLLI